MAGFTLHSNDFQGQVPKTNVYDGMGAGGDNLSPDLRWENAPDGTKSFLICLHDPDAPTPGGFYHWCAFDIPANVNSLNEGASKLGMPAGSKQTQSSYGTKGYGGCCPPPGDPAHAYHFTLYALDTEELGLTEDAPPSKVIFMAQPHLLGKAGITGFYAR